MAQGKLLKDSFSVADSAGHQNLDSLGTDSLAIDSSESRRLESDLTDTDSLESGSLGSDSPESGSLGSDSLESESLESDLPGWPVWNDLSDSVEPDPVD